MLFVHKWPKIIKNWENYYFPESVFFEYNILKTICSTCIAVLFYLGTIYVLSFIFPSLKYQTVSLKYLAAYLT